MAKINAKKFSAVMRDIATKVPARVARDVSQDIRRQIMRDMDAGHDPFGDPWEPKVDGTQSRLLKTGKGRAGIDVEPTSGAGFKIVVRVLYMIYHQFGGPSHLRGPGGSYAKRHKNKHFGRDKDRGGDRGHPPQRSFLPFERLPDAWAEIIMAHLERAYEKALN